jgi:pimeloyl-ACP methyl ester carboxylesterase
MGENREVVTLLYLHGVGNGDPRDAWRRALDNALRDAGYPGLDEVEVIAPKYPDVLRTDDGDKTIKIPPVTAPRLSAAEQRDVRRRVERATAELESILGEPVPASPVGVTDSLAPIVLRVLRQAHNYVTKPGIRARTLRMVLDELPEEGEIVIVGHSLGSIIAIDLLRRLPPKLTVTGLVTIGSPAAHPNLHEDSDRLEMKAPVDHVGWWVNVWSNGDAVTGLRGIWRHFPWALDLQVGLGLDHRTTTYLRSKPVATAIGRGLFGSLTKELAIVEGTPDVSLNSLEVRLALWLAYAQFLRDHLKGATQERFGAALRVVQHEVLERLIENYRTDGVRIPQQLLDLRVSPDTPGDRDLPRPKPLTQLSKEEAVLALVALATANPVRPYEIDVPDDVRRQAFHDLTVWMGLGGGLGENLHIAMQSASKAVYPVDQWKLWVGIGIGAAVLVAGPIGLALAAPAGLAGGAAIIGALSAFGPGGMVGGLVTAGAITTTGAGTIAATLVSSSSTAEDVEVTVIQLLTAAILRSREGLEQDLGVWLAMSEIQRQTGREVARLAAYSDEKAPGVEALRRKARAAERAMAYMVKNRLVEGLTDEEPKGDEPFEE